MNIKALSTLLLSALSFNASSDVIISEYVEGSSNNKAIEIYNNSETPVELGQYKLSFFFNGNPTAGNNIQLSGTLPAFSTYVVADDSSDDALKMKASLLASGSFFNGDDFIQLIQVVSPETDVVIDSIGTYETDPGSAYSVTVDGVAYSTQNKTLVRRVNITTGDTDGTDAFDPSVEWNVFEQDDFSNLGMHTTVDSPEDVDPGDGGSDDGSGGDASDPSGDLVDVCNGCENLPQFKDPASFDASLYYADVNQLQADGADPSLIKAKLSEVISSDITRLTYSQVWTAMTATDEDPNNAANVILLYSGRSIPKTSNGSGSVASSNGDNWNREHSWPKSRGFSSSSDEPYTDIHHLRPTDISMNSARGSLSYDESDRALFDDEISQDDDLELRASIIAQTAENFKDNDSFEPRAEVKGDVARMMLYMDTRYEAGGTYIDLILTNDLADNGGTLGKLCTLLQWNMADPISDFEIDRNNAIYQYQGNRNPFIDNPEWVELLYPIESCDSVTGGGSDDGSGGGSDDGSGGGSTGGNSASPLVITAIFDGPLSGGVPKGIEVYAAQDISDLSTCSIRGTNNGGTPTETDFGQSIVRTTGDNSASKGEFLYFSSEAPGFLNFFGFASDATSSELNINGDDVVQLLCDNEVVDTYGVLGVDGSGEIWEYLDGWAYRNADTLAKSVFNADDWVISGKNALDSTSSNNPVLIPVGTYSLTQGGVIISEYIEGSSNNKAIEVANLTGAEIDLATYSIRVYSNANATTFSEVTLAGTLAANSVYVIANTSANADIQAIADTTSNVISFNGNDSVVLTKDAESIDVIGQLGGNIVWGTGDLSTQNNTIRRKLSVTQGDADGTDAFDPAVEWDGFGTNNIDDLGSYGGFNNGGGGGGGTDGPSDEELLGFCSDDATKIHAVQGNSETSPLLGDKVVVEGVVTLVSASLGGFFMQEEDDQRDADVNTSEGIFIETDIEGLEIQEGDVLRVVGNVSETFGRTLIQAALISSSCASDIVSEVALDLPLAVGFDLESVESMLIVNSDTWYVTDLGSYGRFGELVVSDEVRYTPTHLFAADSAEALALADKNSRNELIVDDLSNGNIEIFDLPAGGFDAFNPIRIGDKLTSVTGIVDFGFFNYRVRPLTTPVLEQVNFRTEAPGLEEGNLKVASFNVLNLFNGDGLGNAFPTPRGAKTAIEYDLQLRKITNAIIAIDADVLGLMEIENDGFDELSSIAQLVDAINATIGADVYSFISAGVPQGTDAISVGIIYKSETVTPDGALKVLTSENSIKDENNLPLFDTSLNRPSFAQQFVLNESDKAFVVNVNHFKSKGSGRRCVQPLDNEGLQGNCNVTRNRAAQALNIWLAAEFSDLPVMIIGDLNAYAKEDAIQTLVGAGYKDLARELEGPLAYSYRFNGQLGSLDYALANEQASEAVVDVTEWHINADEYAGFDYSSNFPRSSSTKPEIFLSESVYRASDHDPVVVSLLLEADVLFGDVNGDGDINFRDYIVIVRAYGASEGSRRYNAAADLDNSGRITFRDILIWYFAYLQNR